MPRLVTFDFTDAPPAVGGGSSDHIPPGEYKLKVEKVEDGTSSNGKRMVTASFRVAAGDFEGKRLVERFVLQSEQGKTAFGLQRLHAFLLSLNLPVQQKATKLDLDKLEGLTFVADVYDDEQPARDNYQARTVSKVGVFRFEQARKSTEKPAAPTVAPAAEAEAPAEAVAPAPDPAPVVAAPAQTDLAAVASEIDDLFK